MGPTLAGFMTWVYSAMGLTTAQLPEDSPYFQWAYDVAIATVNQALNAVPPIYTLAVYNLGGSNLVNWAQDQPGQNVFTNFRQQFNILGPVFGLINSASDEGTSGSLTMPAFVEGLTIGDLQSLKDPWGRQYLAFAANYGTIWGLN